MILHDFLLLRFPIWFKGGQTRGEGEDVPTRERKLGNVRVHTWYVTERRKCRERWMSGGEQRGMGNGMEGGREDGWEKEVSRGLRRKILTREESNQ